MAETNYRFIVADNETRLRLDAFLAQKLNHLSRLRLRRLCREGAAGVNGEVRHGGQRVQTGDVVTLCVAQEIPDSTTPEPLTLDIVHETDSFLVVNKPAGMLVHPTLNVKTGTLLNGLAYHLNCATATDAENWRRPGLVHRLDRDTSGLIAIAKTQRALSILTRHFQQHLVRKSYLALVCGIIDADEITINAPIGRDDTARPFWWWVRETGRPAQTHLTVRTRLAAHTFVALQPVTGRTNQLRIHCAHLGHPIAGDPIYHATDQTAPRLCLHAAQLAFHDPDTGDWQEFHAPWPAALCSLITETGQYPER